MKDPGLKKDAKKINVEFKPLSGTQVEKIIAGFYAAPKDLVKKTWAVINPQ